MRFRATLSLGGKTATGLRVPAEVVEALGPGRSNQRQHVPSVEGTKTPETCERRVAKAVAALLPQR